jgi:two-component system LytT family response regulator
MDKRIQTVIIDDNNEAILTLQGFLEMMPEIEITGTATNSAKAIKMIKELKPELVFLDVEMPVKTGFELLNEFEKAGQQRDFKVIFHTAYDKYTVQALRESAFDFILKPPSENELKEAIHRYIRQKHQMPELKVTRPGIAMYQMVALPSNTGLQFVPKDEIVYLEFQKAGLSLRSSWHVILNNRQSIKLRSGTKASDILDHLGADSFFPLSQAIIVNITYVNMVEYKTQECNLYPPFDNRPLKISRQRMAAFKEKFDMI